MISEIDRLERALEKVARLVVVDIAYTPIFLRLEQEIAVAQSKADAIDRARAIARTSSRTKAPSQFQTKQLSQPRQETGSASTLLES